MEDSELYLKATIDAKGAKTELDSLNKKAADLDKQGTQNLGNLSKKSKGFFNDMAENAKKTGASIKKNIGGVFTGAGSVLSGFVRTAKSVAVSLGVVTAGVGLFANAASDVNEETNKLSVIFSKFGQSAIDAVNKVIELNTATGAFSELGAKRAVSTLADIATGMGLTGDEAVKLVEDFTPLAADIASFKNIAGGATQVIGAFNAALVGEREPLKRLGIVITEETLKQKAMAEGIKIANGALTAQQKAMLTHKLIMEQTTSAQGDFVRTSIGLANSVRIAQNVMQDLTTTLGRLFIPIVSPLVSQVTEMGRSFNVWAKSSEGVEKTTSILSKVLATLATVLAPIKVIIDELVQAFVDIFKAWDDSSDKADEYGQSVARVASVVEAISDTIVAMIRILIDGTGQIIATIDLLIKAMDITRWGDTLKKDFDNYNKYIKVSGEATSKALSKVFDNQSKNASETYKKRQEELQKITRESLGGSTKVELDLGMANEIKEIASAAQIAETPLAKLKESLNGINLTNTNTAEQLRKSMSDYIDTARKLKEEGYELNTTEKAKLDIIKDTLPLLEEERRKRQGILGIGQLGVAGARGSLKVVKDQLKELDSQLSKITTQAKAQEQSLKSTQASYSKNKNQILDPTSGRTIYKEEFDKLSKEEQNALYKQKEERLRLETQTIEELTKELEINQLSTKELLEQKKILQEASRYVEAQVGAWNRNEEAIRRAKKQGQSFVEYEKNGEKSAMRIGDAVRNQFEQAQKIAGDFFDSFNGALDLTASSLNGIFDGITSAMEGNGSDAANQFVQGFSPVLNSIVPGLGSALSAVTSLITSVITFAIDGSSQASKERTKQLELDIQRIKTEIETVENRLDYISQKLETLKGYNEIINSQLETERKLLQIELLKAGKSQEDIEKALLEFDQKRSELRKKQIEEEIKSSQNKLDLFKKEYEKILGVSVGDEITQDEYDRFDAVIKAQKQGLTDLQSFYNELSSQDYGDSIKGDEERAMDAYLDRYNALINSSEELRKAGLSTFANPGNWGAQDKKEFETYVQKMMTTLQGSISTTSTAEIQEILKEIEALKQESLDIEIEALEYELELEREKAELISETIDKQNAYLDRISKIGGNVNTVRELAFANMFQSGIEVNKGLEVGSSTQIGTQIVQTVSNNLNLGVGL